MALEPSTHQQDGQARTLLLVLCGLPGAGKSTLAAQLVAHASSAAAAGRWQGAARHICFDELGCGVEPVAFSPENWRLGRQRALEAVADALHAAAAAQAPSRAAAGGGGGSSGSMASTRSSSSGGTQTLIVVDDNHHLRSMREDAYSLARVHGTAYAVLHLRCSPELASQRNAARPPTQRVPAEALARMSATLEPPGAASAPPWDREAIVVDSGSSDDVATVWQRVLEAWGPPAAPPFDAAAAAAAKAEARQATAASLLHSVDLACRQAIGEAMQRLAGAPKERRAAAAARLNGARQALLAELKQRQHQAAAGGSQEDAGQAWIAAFQQRVQPYLGDPG